MFIAKEMIAVAESIMLDKAKDFAVNIVNLCKHIKETKRESVLTNQLLRAGTSIGANIHGYIPGKQYKPLQNDCGAIRRMLIASINTTKENEK